MKLHMISLRKFTPVRFVKCRSGMAATEFALLIPVLLTLFFGVVEGSDALSANRKVALAANTLADLTAQETEILKADADDLFVGVANIIDTQGAAITINLVSVIADPDGNPVVHWSYDNHGAEPYTAGNPYNDLPDAALLDANNSVVVAEVVYTYSSKLTHYIFSDMNFEEHATRWPRRSLRVQLCASAGNCTS